MSSTPSTKTAWVAEHAVADVDAGAGEPACVEDAADGEYDTRTEKDLTVGQLDDNMVGCSVPAHRCDAKGEVGSVAPVEFGDDAAAVVAQYAAHQLVGAPDDGDLAVELAGAGGDFAAGESGAEHQDAAAGGGNAGSQCPRVLESAQHVYARVAAGCAGQMTRLYAGADDESVVRQFFAAW
jgi:hypothetical protein